MFKVLELRVFRGSWIYSLRISGFGVLRVRDFGICHLEVPVQYCYFSVRFRSVGMWGGRGPRASGFRSRDVGRSRV